LWIEAGRWNLDLTWQAPPLEGDAPLVTAELLARDVPLGGMAGPLASEILPLTQWRLDGYVLSRLSLNTSIGARVAPDRVALKLYRALGSEELLPPQGSSASGGGVELPWPPRLP
jgi:hypothetical protein